MSTSNSFFSHWLTIRVSYAARVAVTVLVVVSVAGGLGSTPAGAQFPLFMSKSDERRIGAEEHPKILKEFGGAYSDPQVSSYVATIAGRMAIGSPMNPNELTFTVLNSPVVNAMALPGGYVYVTRGLMALSNSEAELAAVIAHEIGHVVERHSAKRYNKAQAIGIGGLLAQVLTGSTVVGNVLGAGGTLFLLNNSRQDEYEADLRGTEYSVVTGYDPYAMSYFLGSLEMQNALHAKITGSQYDANQVGYLSTHPNTLKRQRRAREAAQATGIAPGSRPAKTAEYFSVIDGLLYGDDPREGYIRDRTFWHPSLRFTFTVPEGFRLTNSPAHVDAIGPGDSRVRFDFGQNKTGGNMALYVNEWGKELRLQDMQTYQVNGMNAATAYASINTEEGKRHVRFLAIGFSDTQIARFMMLTRTNMTSQITPDLQTMANSFRRLGAKEAKDLKPLRVRVVTVRRGDTIQSLAGRMAFEDYQLDRFLALNRLEPNATLTRGQLVKIVAE